MGFFKIFNEKDIYYIFLYLLASTAGLIFLTKPKFGYSLIPKTKFTIGLGLKELYFYLGYIVIGIILLLYIAYIKIKNCIEEYRKINIEYKEYSAMDFITKNVSDIFKDTIIKNIHNMIPFGIFFIITLVYTAMNFASKVAPPLKIFTTIVNTFKVIILPIINIIIFLSYYLSANSTTC